MIGSMRFFPTTMQKHKCSRYTVCLFRSVLVVAKSIPWEWVTSILQSSSFPSLNTLILNSGGMDNVLWIELGSDAVKELKMHCSSEQPKSQTFPQTVDHTINGVVVSFSLEADPSFQSCHITVKRKGSCHRWFVKGKNDLMFFACNGKKQYQFCVPREASVKELKQAALLMMARRGIPFVRNLMVFTINGKKPKNNSKALQFVASPFVLYKQNMWISFQTTKPVKFSLYPSMPSSVMDKLTAPACLFTSELTLYVKKGAGFEWLKRMTENCYPHLKRLRIESE